MPAPFDVEKVKADFPLLAGSDLCYLDNAATTQKPQAVIDAISHYYSHQNANVHRSLYPLAELATASYESARDKLQAFINARSRREIIWTSGTTDAINLLAQSFGCTLNAGDEIILSQLEHHANIVPWQMLAERQGILIKVIPVTAQGDLDTAAFHRLLSDKTKLVSVSHISNALGTINPIAEIISKAHQVGAKVHIDGAQAVAHTRVDVQALDCDFYSFSGHKLYGPTGIGVLYGKEALLNQLAPAKGGGEMIERVSFEGTTFTLPPLKFEAGTPAIAQAIGLGAAVDYLHGLDHQTVQQHEQALLQHALEGLRDIAAVNWIARPQQQAPIVSFTCKGIHSFDIATLLGSQNIAIRSGHHCTMPLMQQLGVEGTSRLSIGIYNSREDIEQFCRALDELTRPDSVSVQSGTSEPEPGSAEPAETDLIAELQAINHWQQRYAYIIKLGQHSAPLTAEERTAEALVHGCTSQVWLQHEFQDGMLSVRIDSDARIMRGLGAILAAAVNGKSADEIRQFDIKLFMHGLGLDHHLSASRTNGFLTIFAAIQALAHAYSN